MEGGRPAQHLRAPQPGRHRRCGVGAGTLDPQPDRRLREIQVPGPLARGLPLVHDEPNGPLETQAQLFEARNPLGPDAFVFGPRPSRVRGRTREVE